MQHHSRRQQYCQLDVHLNLYEALHENLQGSINHKISKCILEHYSVCLHQKFICLKFVSCFFTDVEINQSKRNVKTL